MSPSQGHAFAPSELVHKWLSELERDSSGQALGKEDGEAERPSKDKRRGEHAVVRIQRHIC